jgi:hypothetical protein
MKKNLLKVPQNILDRLKTFAQDDVIVACVKRLSASDLSAYAPLGVVLKNGQLTIPAPFIPKASTGRYSKVNVAGKDIKRKDLPMTTRSYSWESPNWGDWSKGSHTHSITREVYQTEFIPPKEVQLSIEKLPSEKPDEFVLKFAIDQVLSKRSADFEQELL